MHASAVIGMNFGDEGKGLVTDFLCHRLDASLVVRFNGGAQAGHTVVDGNREVTFSHFGSGTLLGVPTYLASQFIVNPRLWHLELLDLMESKGLPEPVLYVNPACRLTTPYDVLLNHAVEAWRGKARHGSVGSGIFETVARCGTAYFTTVADALKGEDHLRATLGRIAQEWVPQRIDRHAAAFPEGAEALRQDVHSRILSSNQAVDSYVESCAKFAESARVIAQIPNELRDEIVFEGAQGLLLDEKNTEFWPYLTPSRTGLPNVLEICRQIGVEDLDAYYVTRTYMTRHGPGPFPSEVMDRSLWYPDPTNHLNPHQGHLRFGSLDLPLMHKAVQADLANVRVFRDMQGFPRVYPSVALTWATGGSDEHRLVNTLNKALGIPVTFTCRGRTRNEVDRYRTLVPEYV